MTIDQKVLDILKAMGNEDLQVLKAQLLPALIAQVEALSPAGAQAYEVAVFTVLQPAIQTALEALIAGIEL